MNGGPECARCGSEVADVHVTALGVDYDVVVTDGKFLINFACVEEPDTIQIEGICKACGHARYIQTDQWEWA